jgi:uroporphyrin-III C-methyltransferase
MSGKVYLVGAGPGDPDLLTVRALRLLRTAEVVLHDDLVSPEILKLISSFARIQNVGKRCGRKTLRQEEINFLMVEWASSGRQVIRLKSGDPLIFGRAGEEIEALRRANVEYEIVPGITSALGAAASIGMPLTHRYLSSTLVLTAGHRASESSRADLKNIASPRETLVVYMPGKNYAEIAARLLSAGFDPGTPCAIVSRATTPGQETYYTTVENLDQNPNLVSPTLLIVGDVVRLAHRLVGQDAPGLATFNVLTAGNGSFAKESAS